MCSGIHDKHISQIMSNKFLTIFSTFRLQISQEELVSLFSFHVHYFYDKIYVLKLSFFISLAALLCMYSENQ